MLSKTEEKVIVFKEERKKLLCLQELSSSEVVTHVGGSK